jgi:hypothetical protein
LKIAIVKKSDETYVWEPRIRKRKEDAKNMK